MKAIAYIRVSTDKQELGPEVQRMAILTKAKELNLEVTFFEDIGISGKLNVERREGLTQALSMLCKNDVLIVAKLDRLSRDLLNQLIIERMIDKAGAKLISCANEGTQDEGPTAKMIRGILGVMAEYEREVIKARTTQALALKRSRSEKTGGYVPYGFQKEGKLILKDDVEQGVISYIKDQVSKGRAMYNLAKELNADNVPTKRIGGRWSATQIKRILEY